MASGSAPYDIQIKLLICGDYGVGKTCLVLRYANDSFNPTFITTIGIDNKIKNVDIDSTKIKLEIMDTSGQERFRALTTHFFRGAQGILLVYDVTDRRSFESIRNWVSQIQQLADVHVNKLLVGNKCDMLDEKAVSTEEGEKLAKEFGIPFFECSAKNNINVDESFISIARDEKDRLDRLTLNKFRPVLPGGHLQVEPMVFPVLLSMVNKRLRCRPTQNATVLFEWVQRWYIVEGTRRHPGTKKIPSTIGFNAGDYFSTRLCKTHARSL